MIRERSVAWSNCYNVRDLGGIALPFGRRTRFDVVLRADNLDRLTPDGWASAVAYGVRSVVDLRSPTELVNDVSARPAELTTFGIPVFDESDNDTILELYRATTTVQSYVIMLGRCSHAFAAALHTIANAEPVVVVHCQAGRDRTGLVVALVLGLVGATPATIAEDYELSELRLQPLYDRLIEATQSEDTRAILHSESRAARETMLDILAHVDAEYGGIESYVRTIGVDDQDVLRLRARLVG